MKLNLGSGQNPISDYLNVDKYGSPDLLCDLEVFPWPWENDSVEEVVFNHVLEHLGPTTDSYFGIIQELYRVCRHEAVVHIAAIHPRHDDFLNDPTHVRVITPDSLNLFSKKENLRWAEMRAANTPLALQLNVDFEVASFRAILDEPWSSHLQSGKMTENDLWQAIRQFNNVVREFEIQLKVIKA